MSVSDSLLKKFAESVTKERPEETTTVYGSAVIQNDKQYVQIDGSDRVTPVSLATDMRDGDRVLVSVSNHTAVVLGNISSPSSGRTASETDANLAKATEALENLDLKVNSLEASSITTDYLKAHYADIGLANVENAFIEHGQIKTGVIGTTQIADGSITDAKIVELTANKITAGTLSVERLEIRGTKSSLIYALNNAGDGLISEIVDRIDGHGLADNTVTADKIVADSITAREIAAKSITVNEINVDSLFAADIFASRSINSPIINGGSININDVFTVDSAGKMTATDATISGTIDAASGTIGGYTINDGYLRGEDGSRSASLFPGYIALAFESGPGEIEEEKVICETHIIGQQIYTGYNTSSGSSHSAVLECSPARVAITESIGTSYLDASTLKLAFGGGWYMSDTSWIRNYGSKYVYIDNLLRVDGNVYFGPSGSWYITSNGGAMFDGVTCQMTSDNSSSSCQLRIVHSSYGFLIRNDGNDTWGLLTNNGDPYGGWSKYPIRIHNSTGEVIMQHGIYDLAGYNNTTSNNNPVVYVTSTSNGGHRLARYASSSKRYKHDIESAPEELYTHLLELPVVTYHYNKDYDEADPEGNLEHIGFIAEDVERLYPKACGYDTEGKPENWNVMELVPGMLALIQDQNNEIKELRTQLDQLAAQVGGIQNESYA